MFFPGGRPTNLAHSSLASHWKGKTGETLPWSFSANERGTRPGLQPKVTEDRWRILDFSWISCWDNMYGTTEKGVLVPRIHLNKLDMIWRVSLQYIFLYYHVLPFITSFTSFNCCIFYLFNTSIDTYLNFETFNKMYYIFIYYHYFIFYNLQFGSINYHFFHYLQWCFAFINIYPNYSIITGGLVDENFNLLKRCCKSKPDAQNELSMI